MQNSPANNQRMDKIDYIEPAAGTSQSTNQRSDKYEADDYRGSDNKRCFRSIYCRRGKNLRKHFRMLQLRSRENSNNCSSTQTWEPWSRTTCVSKSQFKKCNRILICTDPHDKQSLEENQLCNDGYNRLCDFKNRLLNDREKIYAEAKTSTTTCKHDGCGVCEAMRDRVFAEMALQTDRVSSNKIINCGLSEDQPVIENLKLEKRASKATLKSRLSPGPSSVIKTSKVKPAKRKTGVNLRDKKSTVKKRSVPKSDKKLSTAGKIINANSSRSRAEKFHPEIKKGRHKIPKKLTQVENEREGTENILAETIPVNIVELEEGINEVIKAVVKKKKLDNDDQVFTKKSEHAEVDLETGECSIKCQGVPNRRIFDNAESQPATRSSTGSSSKRRLENGSVTTPESNILRRKTTYNVKKMSTIKSPRSRQRSSTSNSSECEDYDAELARPCRKGSDSKSSKNYAGKKTGDGKIRNGKSDAVYNSENISTDLSRGTKFNTTTIHEKRDRDQSRSFDNGKLNNQKSPMMIWNWLRERYGTTSSSLIGSNDRSILNKDPFLSLFISRSLYEESKIKSKNYRKLNRVG